jgi:hypothetical protein
MDAWREVYVDKDGVSRCSRCHHTRPNQGPSQNTNTPSKPLNPEDKAQRLGKMVGQMIKQKVSS